jgi:hypothetical protein
MDCRVKPGKDEFFNQHKPSVRRSLGDSWQ